MAVGRILVIAPDRDFRRSLAFMLEAEGYAVEVLAELPDQASAADAVVLDQAALAGPDAQTLAFLRSAPIVLLATRPHPWLVGLVTAVVDIPAIGNAVSLALGRAMQVPA